MPQKVDKKGQEITKEKLMSELKGLNPDDKYKKQKAAGSIGGSVAHDYLKREGNQYVCQRDAKKLNNKVN